MPSGVIPTLHACRGKAVYIGYAEDISSIAKKKGQNFFHNKCYMEYDHSVMRCMEERIAEKNKLEYQEDIINQTTCTLMTDMAAGEDSRRIS